MYRIELIPAANQQKIFLAAANIRYKIAKATAANSMTEISATFNKLVFRADNFSAKNLTS
jgi:hypothetical protein